MDCRLMRIPVSKSDCLERYRTPHPHDPCLGCAQGRMNAREFGFVGPQKPAKPANVSSLLEAETHRSWFNQRREKIKAHKEGKEMEDNATMTCRECGATKPLDQFQRNYRVKNKEGRLEFCNDCMVKKRSEGFYRKAIKVAEKQGVVVRSPDAMDPVQELFAGHSDLWQWVCEQAKKQYRTPEGQVLAIVADAMGANG